MGFLPRTVDYSRRKAIETPNINHFLNEIILIISHIAFDGKVKSNNQGKMKFFFNFEYQSSANDKEGGSGRWALENRCDTSQPTPVIESLMSKLMTQFKYFRSDMWSRGKRFQ